VKFDLGRGVECEMGLLVLAWTLLSMWLGVCIAGEMVRNCAANTSGASFLVDFYWKIRWCRQYITLVFSFLLHLCVLTCGFRELI
jgi:hypothetical protein